MSEARKLTVFTNERRQPSGGQMPANRPPQRQEDMDEFHELVAKVGQSIDRHCEVADSLVQKLAKA